MVIRKNCSESALSAGVLELNGPWPRTAPDMARSVTIARDPVAPRGPNRTAAQRRNGSGRYISAGALVSKALDQMKTRAVMRSRPAPSRPASMLRARDALQALVSGNLTQVRIAGARV